MKLETARIGGERRLRRGAERRDGEGLVPRRRSVNENAWVVAGSREGSGAFRPASPSPPTAPGPGGTGRSRLPCDRGLLADPACMGHGNGEERAGKSAALRVDPEGAEVRGGERPRRPSAPPRRRPPRKGRASSTPGRGGPRKRGGGERTPRTPFRRASSRRASRPSTPASRARAEGTTTSFSFHDTVRDDKTARTVCGPPHACAISATASRRRDSRSATNLG